MENEKNWTIDEIESMTEATAKEMAEETEIIKGYTAYYMDIPKYFGYSVLLFADGAIIKWANDYALHHPSKSREELRKIYHDSLERKLFTSAELEKPYTDYNEKERRRKYINEYFPLRRDHHSIFGIFITEKDKANWLAANEGYTIYCPTAFAYFKECDKDFVDEINRMNAQLEAFDMTGNYDYWFKAFVGEMFNHEYGINYGQADYDTLSAFGNIEWHGEEENEREQYFNELGFNDIQRKAYRDAIKEYYRTAEF